MKPFLISILVHFAFFIVFKRILGSSFQDKSDGPQKIHVEIGTRVGGMAIFSSVVLIVIFDAALSSSLLLPILITTFPVFALGLAEDLTGKVSAKVRLFGSFCAGLLFVGLFQSFVTSIQLPMDLIFRMHWLSGVVITLFAISIFTNAMNIIDGMNGLSAGTSILILIGLLHLSEIIGDVMISSAVQAIIFSLLGFLTFNFPKGRLLLGDSGAYFLGTAITAICILLCERNGSQYYPICILLVSFPLYEICRTAIRRKIMKKSILSPDFRHLHSLVFQHLTSKYQFRKNLANPLTTMIMICLPVSSLIWAFLFIDQINMIWVGITSIIVAYEVLYFLFKGIRAS